MTAIAAPPALRFICPRCRGELGDEPGGYRCALCEAFYPVVAGIPDFRVAPDPWIGLEDDRAKALQLAELSVRLDFADTVRCYWEITPQTARHRAERFTEHVLRAERRSAEWLQLHAAEDADRTPGICLDMGCGTADLALAAARRGERMVAVDVALRWLVVARKRLQEAGFPIPLVCCCAERLPFVDRTFARVLALGLLEHCTDAESALSEAHRTLQTGGVIRTRTVNRFTLLPEPHVDVWGVGFLPRQWADRYVRWRSGARYLFHHPLSTQELRRSLRRVGFVSVRIEAAALLATESARLGRAADRIVPVYSVLRRIPLIRRGLAAVAPLLEAFGVKASSTLPHSSL